MNTTLAMLFGIAPPHPIPRGLARPVSQPEPWRHGPKDSAREYARKGLGQQERTRLFEQEKAGILSLLKEHGELTKGDIEEEMDLSRSQAEHRLYTLREEGRIVCRRVKGVAVWRIARAG